MFYPDVLEIYVDIILVAYRRINGDTYQISLKCDNFQRCCSECAPTVTYRQAGGWNKQYICVEVYTHLHSISCSYRKLYLSNSDDWFAACYSMLRQYMQQRRRSSTHLELRHAISISTYKILYLFIKLNYVYDISLHYIRKNSQWYYEGCRKFVNYANLLNGASLTYNI